MTKKIKTCQEIINLTNHIKNMRQFHCIVLHAHNHSSTYKMNISIQPYLLNYDDNEDDTLYYVYILNNKFLLILVLQYIHT